MAHHLDRDAVLLVNPLGAFPTIGAVDEERLDARVLRRGALHCIHPGIAVLEIGRRDADR